jgi:hypothetical protein
MKRRTDMPKKEPDENVLVWIIAEALKKLKHSEIKKVSVDGDHKSSEVIITTSDGSEWVLRSNAIKPLEE